MKFAVDIGHNCPVKDTGAVGIRREDDLTREVGEKLIKLLQDNGHLVRQTKPERCTDVNESLNYRIGVANLSGVDCLVSIHFNAVSFPAHGAEVYAVSRIGKAIASSVLEEICKLGFHNRGVKRANFALLTRTTMPAILVECCFCTSEHDMKLYDADSMALAIAEGLIGDIEPIENELRCLRVNFGTWVKVSTAQSTSLEPSQKAWINPGKYQLLAALSEEEGHYWVRLDNGTEGFVFAEHAELS
ncbi:MAG: N-acetylmuramoyl-L-alanine amidase [Cyanobacteria bacterium J06623_7]